MQTVIIFLVLNKRTCKQEHYKPIIYYLILAVKRVNSHASCWPIMDLPAGQCSIYRGKGGIPPTVVVDPM